MRIALAAAVAAALAATTASAQDTNQANTAAPPPVATEPDANTVAVEPVPPATNEIVAVEPAMPVTDPGPDAGTRDTDRDGGGFPWGLIGLIGLVGLLGRTRS